MTLYGPRPPAVESNNRPGRRDELSDHPARRRLDAVLLRPAVAAGHEVGATVLSGEVVEQEEDVQDLTIGGKVIITPPV
jgi:hypothetical protein